MDNDDYVNGGGFCCDDNPQLRAGAIGNGNDNPEIYQYYYHSDHLGSTSLITDLDGNVVQHVEYVPFGEVFIEERNNTWNTPYLFNAKELDEETGLYYYEARYYDSRVSVWLGVDPMWEEYSGISVFAYCLNNPLKYTDPTGMDTVWVHSDGTEIFRIKADGAEIMVVNEPLPEVVVTAPKNDWELLKPDYNLDGQSAWWEWGIDGILYAGDFVLGGPTGESLAAKVALVGLTAGAKGVAKKAAIKLTNKQIVKLATKNGMKEVKEFGLKNGQKVFKKGNKYYSYDIDSHNGGVWKVFEKAGNELKRIGTANENLVIFKN
jgi:RHS repeat-associated protein